MTRKHVGNEPKNQNTHEPKASFTNEPSQEKGVPQPLALTPAHILYLQRTIGNQAVQRLLTDTPQRSRVFAPTALQRQAQAASAPVTAGATPTSSGGPPIIIGMNTTEYKLYASVLAPGHTVEEIVNYIYMFPEVMIEQFRSENSGLPDNLDEMIPAGRNLRIPEGRPSERFVQDRDAASKSGAMLRTEGMEEGDTGAMLYTFSAGGRTYQLTEGQMRGMLLSLQRKLKDKAELLAGSARFGLQTQQEHIEGTNRVIRWMAGGEMPPESEWNTAIQNAEQIRDVLSQLDLTSDLVAAARIVQNMTGALEAVARHVDDLEARLRAYFRDTIAGAETVKSKLELVRDVSFATAAAIGMVVAAPIAVASAGSVMGTSTAGIVGAHAVGGLGTYYGVRSGVGLVRGGSDLIGQAATGDVDMDRVSQETMAGFEGTKWDRAAEWAMLALSLVGPKLAGWLGSGGRGGSTRSPASTEPPGEAPSGAAGPERPGTSSGRATVPSAGPTAETPAQMVARLRSEGHEVIVNIGGTGAPHEPQQAINLNPNIVAPRKGIPNHVPEPGEKIGSLFGSGSVDQVVGHHLPPNVLNWNEVAPGAYKVLRSGGQFEIYFRGAHPEDAANLANALRQGGFRDVEVKSDVLIRAVKP